MNQDVMNQEAQPLDDGRSTPRRSAGARLLRKPMVMVPATILLGIVIAGLFAPALAPYDPQHASLDAVLAPYGSAHWLGGDAGGRDVLSRLLYGIRPTLAAVLISDGVALGLGVPAGLVAGYYGRRFNAVASWLASLLQAAPAVVIMLTLSPAFGGTTAGTMTILGVLMSSGTFLLTRNTVRSVRDELYVDAARVSGLSDGRIIARHLSRVVRGPLIISTSLTAGIAIVVQAGLQFLGIGSPNEVTWGGMLSDAFSNINKAPSLVYAPGIAIGLTVACLAVLGSAVADTLSDTTGGRSTAPRKAAAPPRKAAAPLGKAAAPPRRAAATSTATCGTVAAPVEGMSGQAPPAPEGALLAVRDLRISYPGGTDSGPRTVVRGVSLHVNRGEVLGLVGESGSGKSQTSFGILGLLPPSATVRAGQLTLAGHDLRGMSAKDHRALLGPVVGYVPQEPISNLDPSFTIGHQLVEPMRVHLGLSRTAARDKAQSLLRDVGIVDPVGTMAKYPHEISGGMAQRVLIAGAVSCDPQLIIADEPTTALDVTVQAEVLNLLRHMRTQRDLAVLLVTHNLGVVADLCDRVAVMRDGVIVEDRPVRDLFRHPAHDYTRTLLAATLDDASPRGPYQPEANSHAL